MLFSRISRSHRRSPLLAFIMLIYFWKTKELEWIQYSEIFNNWRWRLMLFSVAKANLMVDSIVLSVQRKWIYYLLKTFPRTVCSFAFNRSYVLWKLPLLDYSHNNFKAIWVGIIWCAIRHHLLIGDSSHFLHMKFVILTRTKVIMRVRSEQ